MTHVLVLDPCSIVKMKAASSLMIQNLQIWNSRPVSCSPRKISSSVLERIMTLLCDPRYAWLRGGGMRHLASSPLTGDAEKASPESRLDGTHSVTRVVRLPIVLLITGPRRKQPLSQLPRLQTRHSLVKEEDGLLVFAVRTRLPTTLSR
jgi:hypothetical protein